MKFSIIIAAYNVANYVTEAIDSCLNQQGVANSDYEIIVIDDGAKDDTGLIIDGYSNVANVRIVHQQNCGLSGTRNYGIQLAKGDFICLLDGDDWLAPNALAELSKYIEKADLIVFPMVYHYPDGKTIKKSYNLQNREYNNQEFLHETIGRSLLNIIPAPCKVYRRQILIDNNQRFVEKILHEDNPFFIDTVANFKKIYYTDEGLYYYRQNREGSITASQTIRNFNGTIAGIEHIKKVIGYKNKDVNYLISCWHVFQVILNYKEVKDYRTVTSYYRRFSTKVELIKLLFYSTVVPKQKIRTLLLLIDPSVLKIFCKILYGK